MGEVFNDVFHSLKISLPSCFSIGDYMIVVIILKSLIAYTMNLELTTATGYLTSYYSLFLFSIGYGLNESIGIYCAQSWGSKDSHDRGKMYLMYKQACVIMIIYYLTVTTPLSFFFKRFLVNVIGANPEVAIYAQKLVMYCLPGLFIRSMTDIFKSYAQAQDIIAQLGYFTLMNLIIVPFYAYFLIVYMDLGAIAYGLSIFIYEIGNTIIAVLVWKNMIHEDTKKTHLKLGYKFGWFLCESIKNLLTILHVFLAYESVIVIISQLHDDGQLGAYTILFNVGEALRLIAKGFTIYGRTEVNKYIGKGWFKTAKSVYFKIFTILVCLSAIIHVLLLIGFHFLFKRPLVHPDI